MLDRSVQFVRTCLGAEFLSWFSLSCDVDGSFRVTAVHEDIEDFKYGGPSPNSKWFKTRAEADAHFDQLVSGFASNNPDAVRS